MLACTPVVLKMSRVRGIAVGLQPNYRRMDVSSPRFVKDG